MDVVGQFRGIGGIDGNTAEAFDLEGVGRLSTRIVVRSKIPTGRPVPVRVPLVSEDAEVFTAVEHQ